MIRGLVFLLIAVAIVALVMSLVRRSRRTPEYQAPPEPNPADVPTPALPAPDDDAGPVLSVDEVLHKLNELAFARSLTTSAGCLLYTSDAADE